MDKRLKKLSRVELLELLVSLSEDYENLADENARLKQTLSARRLPRSAKVGSLAEAALQASGYFAAVQRSADEYLLEIKHLRDELARRTEEQSRSAAAAHAASARQAERQAHLELQQAQVRSSRIISNANSQAESILADARSRAEKTLADANRRSHAMLSQAQHQAFPSASRNAAARDSARQSIRSVPSPAYAAYASSPGVSTVGSVSHAMPFPHGAMGGRAR